MSAILRTGASASAAMKLKNLSALLKVSFSGQKMVCCVTLVIGQEWLHQIRSRKAFAIFCLDRYMQSKVDQMREELGVVPDIPQERSLAGPEITSSAGVRAWGEGNQAAVEGRAPDVNVRASSRDTSLADDVAGRIEYGQERILDGGRGRRDEGVSAYRGAARQRDGVDERNHASLARTIPVVSRLLDKVDDFMGG